VTRPAPLPFRPDRLTPPYHSSYLLEVFELGDGPIDTGERHAVWLRVMIEGGYRWECSCGTRTEVWPQLSYRLLTEARYHFERKWKPRAVPIWHPIAIWNDRAERRKPPTPDDLEKLAVELLQLERTSA
jgi:hypothetical protein